MSAGTPAAAAPAGAGIDAGAWWRTSAFGDLRATPAHELSALGEHLHSCRLGGRLSAFGCGVEALHRQLASRFVTTLALALLVIGIGMLAF